MPSTTQTRTEAVRAGPSMLDLVRLSRKTLFPPGGKDLYRHIARLTDMSSGQEVLVAACGSGVTIQYFVQELEVVGSATDFAEEIIAAAEARVQAAGMSHRLHFQAAPLDRLPYRDSVFDIAIGELALTARVDPEAAVQELVRVTKPGGVVVLIQLVWTAPVPAERQEILIEHLGTRPLMLVEWKKLLRESGVVDFHVEDWSDAETAFRPHVKMPFPVFGELFTLWERLLILLRAWARWGWRGVGGALAREREVHRLLTDERLLGLALIKGVKWKEAEVGAEAERAGASRGAAAGAGRASGAGGAGDAGLAEGISSERYGAGHAIGGG